MEYKVEWIKDFEYKVVDEFGENVFQGSITDCKSWIDLTERNLLS